MSIAKRIDEWLKTLHPALSATIHLIGVVVGSVTVVATCVFGILGLGRLLSYLLNIDVGSGTGLGIMLFSLTLLFGFAWVILYRQYSNKGQK